MGGGRTMIPCGGCDCYPAFDDFCFDPVGQKVSGGKGKKKKKEGGCTWWALWVARGQGPHPLRPS